MGRASFKAMKRLLIVAGCLLLATAGYAAAAGTLRIIHLRVGQSVRIGNVKVVAVGKTRTVSKVLTITQTQPSVTVTVTGPTTTTTKTLTTTTTTTVAVPGPVVTVTTTAPTTTTTPSGP